MALTDGKPGAEPRARRTRRSDSQATPGDVRMEDVICWLSDNLPDDAVIANGAGNYSGWVHRYYRFRNYRTQLAPTSGSMGYGVPAAVGRKPRHLIQPWSVPVTAAS